MGRNRHTDTTFATSPVEQVAQMQVAVPLYAAGLLERTGGMAS